MTTITIISIISIIIIIIITGAVVYGQFSRKELSDQ